jgi:hypothetical protein
MTDSIFAARRSLRNAMVEHSPSPLVSSRLTEHTDAWTANPRCLVCETTTPSVERSAFLRTEDGPRVTCRSACFSLAVQRTNPTFSRATAMRRAGGTT